MARPSSYYSPQSRYSSVAVVLHWLIALMIFANIALAWTFQNIPKGQLFFQLIQLHKSFGVSVLLLSFIRLAWRLYNPPPTEPPMPGWQALAASVVHWSFYVIMIGMPISGWIMVSSSPLGLPTLLFNTIPWPHIAAIHNLPDAAKKMWSRWSGDTHGILAKLAYVLILLHVGAASKHQFFDRDNLIYRIAPFIGRRAPKEPVHAP